MAVHNWLGLDFQRCRLSLCLAGVSGPSYPEVKSDFREFSLQSDPRSFYTIIASGLLKPTKTKGARGFPWLSDAALNHGRVDDGEGHESAH